MPTNDNARIIAAIDTLQATQFRRGRVPTGDDGTYVHDAHNTLRDNPNYLGTIELFVEHGVPLVAVAEAVRIGVLNVAFQSTKLVFSKVVTQESATVDLEYAAGAPHVVACPRCTLDTVPTGFDKVDVSNPLVAPELGLFETRAECANCHAQVRIRIECSTFVAYVREAP